MPVNRLCLIGAGGFGRQAVALLQDIDLAAETFAQIVFAAEDAPQSAMIGPYPVIDTATMGSGDRFVVTVSNPVLRRRLAHQALAAGAQVHHLIAASARISPLAEIAKGEVVCDFAVIEPFARIGCHFHANVGAFVAHECVIGDFVTLAPRAICNGNVHIGDGATIGAGAVIRQGTNARPLVIGAGATVGMGAVVTRDVAAGQTVAGNPARPLHS